jgi:hypothetical protein
MISTCWDADAWADNTWAENTWENIVLRIVKINNVPVSLIHL